MHTQFASSSIIVTEFFYLLFFFLLNLSPLLVYLLNLSVVPVLLLHLSYILFLLPTLSSVLVNLCTDNPLVLRTSATILQSGCGSWQQCGGHKSLVQSCFIGRTSRRSFEDHSTSSYRPCYSCKLRRRARAGPPASGGSPANRCRGCKAPRHHQLRACQAYREKLADAQAGSPSTASCRIAVLFWVD